ncbi:MAG: PEGA domain-containing protein [Deltaproteobacteria bacterium]|nr:PEGA domain-containing protein [Deltaproteobacteria bacterium]
MKKLAFKALCLWITLLFFVPPVTAKEPGVAVLELRHASVSPTESRTMAQTLRKKLSTEGKVLSEAETREGLSGFQDQTPVSGLGAVYETAMQNYRRLELETAERELKRKLGESQRGESPKGGMTLEDAFHLVPATLLLGELAQAQGRQKEAVFYFREAARLSLDTPLNEKRYSPQIRKLYEREKETLLKDKQKLARVRVESPVRGKGASPKGDSPKVHLNGILKGEAPLVLSGLPTGRHYVTVTAEGYRPYFSPIDLSPGVETGVTATLEKMDTGQQESLGEAPFAGFSVSSLQAQEEITGKAVSAGKLLGVDQVILVSVTGEGGQFQATARLVDVVSRRLQPAASIGFDKTSRSREAASAKLASHLTAKPLAIAQREGSSVPRSPLGGSPLGGAPLKNRFVSEEKPLWVKPIFWIISGVILAGAGTGIGLALSSGGGASEVPVTVSGNIPSVTGQ